MTPTEHRRVSVEGDTYKKTQRHGVQDNALDDRKKNKQKGNPDSNFGNNIIKRRFRALPTAFAPAGAVAGWDLSYGTK